MNLPVKKVENHTYNLKYGTADSASRRNSGNAYVIAALAGMAKESADGVFITH